MKMKFYICNMKISNKVKKLIYSMFDTMVEGVDKYETKSSTWLIFTDEKKWVLEFTKENILWFNYNTFQSELVLVGMDCADSKDVIKEWFESRFLGIEVENTIQNGVKHTVHESRRHFAVVEDTIQNGVKRTELSKRDFFPKETIQNGVKHTSPLRQKKAKGVEDTIQNGVKHALSHFGSFPLPSKNNIQNVIKNGVKETIGTLRRTKLGVDDIIKNGVKS
jgi:hypothetical protein